MLIRLRGVSIYYTHSASLLVVKSLPKVLFSSLAGMIVFGAISAILVLTVTYLPYGVPESRREEYEDKIAEIKEHQELLRNADDTQSSVAIVEQTKFDFGMVDPHTTLSHSFRITNNGDLPLALEVQKTSCKCTVGDLATNLVPPGESTDVTMTWNTGYQAESYEQTATVATNDPLQKTIELTVKGIVRAKLISPPKVVFGATDPGKPAETSFVTFSQLWGDYEITDVKSDLVGFSWSAEPVAPDDVSLIDKEAKSAWRVNLVSVGNRRGSFSGNLRLTFQPNDGSKPEVRQVDATGKVRAPINFYSPDIHNTEGLDVGTLISDKEHAFHLVVRNRVESERKLDVLDVKPEELEADLEPLSKAGSYRLTIRVPKDCPMVIFNRDSKHGYVQVGDPSDETFSNWFPLRGAVVAAD